MLNAKESKKKAAAKTKLYAEQQRIKEEKATTKAKLDTERHRVKEEKAAAKAKRDAAKADEPGDDPDEYPKYPTTLEEVIKFLADELHLERPSTGPCFWISPLCFLYSFRVQSTISLWMKWLVLLIVLITE